MKGAEAFERLRLLGAIKKAAGSIYGGWLDQSVWVDVEPWTRYNGAVLLQERSRKSLSGGLA